LVSQRISLQGERETTPAMARPSGVLSIKPVRSTLNHLREVVQTHARDLTAGVLAEIRDVELLKRSVYGASVA
jgi:hypothetical protein